MIRRRPTSSSPLGADDGNDEGAILMEIAKHIKRDNNKSFALSSPLLSQRRHFYAPLLS